jgi:hypothetical protein
MLKIFFIQHNLFDVSIIQNKIEFYGVNEIVVHTPSLAKETLSSKLHKNHLKTRLKVIVSTANI